MNRLHRHFSALMISGRLTNLPSVFSEIFAGMCLGWAAIESSVDFSGEGVPVFFSGMFFYLSGMWGNDAKDAGWDRERYADRPIPSGMISRGMMVFWAILALFVAFVLLPRNTYIVGGVLALSIVLYTWTHKFFSGSVLFMAICRVSLLWMGYFSVTPLSEAALSISALLWVASMALFFYLVGLTAWARGESQHRQRIKHVGLLLACLPLWDVLWVSFAQNIVWAFLPLGLFLVSILLKKKGVRSS